MKIDASEFEKLLRNMENIAEVSMREAGDYFRSKTPIDKGNARRNTSTRGKKISADYAYAGRLDDGWSRQAPNGMSEPTVDQLDDIVYKNIGKL